MNQKTPKADTLFEISWEVCNKVGGINTVIISKLPNIMEKYKDKEYFCIGPYFKENLKGEFIEERPPTNLQNIFDKLKAEGIRCHYGTWFTATKPKAILIDSREHFALKDKIKTLLWEKHNIDSYNSPYDFDEPAVWGHAVSRFLEEYHYQDETKKIVAQFHEWMAGLGLLFLQQTKIATVFTTHASMIGRTLASKGVDIYSKFHEINADEESYRNGMHFKQQTEKACATSANAFTTVSEITGIETESFYGKKPDVLTLNGLDTNSFPTFEESSINHKLYNEKIRDFVMAHFFPYYSFDVENTRIYYIAGRPEFHVKGVDLLIQSLAELNQKLKDDSPDKTVVVLFLIPGWVERKRNSIINAKTHFSLIKQSILDNINTIRSNLFQKVAANDEVNNDIIPTDLLQTIQKRLLAVEKQNQNPPICTHHLHNEDYEPILQELKKVGLQNKKSDRVKIIFYPEFLTGADGLLNLDYYSAISGSHLGIFPSYYEPWGYTPLECAMLGVPTITTDLAGFGRFIKSKRDENCSSENEKGIFILEREKENWDSIKHKLAEILFKYTNLPKHKRIENKIKANELAKLADWNFLVENYIDAHNIAIDKKFN